MEWLIGIAIFAAALCIILGILLALRPKWDTKVRDFNKRLDTFASSSLKAGTQTDIVKKRRTFSDIPTINELLSKMSIVHRLDLLVVGANSTLPLGVFLLISCILAFSTYLILFMLSRGHFVPALFGIGMSTTPFLYLMMKKGQRMAKFERQLPDALDLMARSLKAGHAFSGGLHTVAQEFDDPIGPEFMKTLTEINLGSSVEQALKNLTARIDVPDLKFFAVSVIIQRETGGNLADILENTAQLIRERFKLLGKIKALSAEGKLTAIILIGLPFAVVGILTLTSPKYIQGLANDPAGKVFIIIALCMMACGVAIIRKIINIKV
ncbi:pilus assembly protein [bacterium]|nr:pilus assembly protein [bacterium]